MYSQHMTLGLSARKITKIEITKMKVKWKVLLVFDRSESSEKDLSNKWQTKTSPFLTQPLNTWHCIYIYLCNVDCVPSSPLNYRTVLFTLSLSLSLSEDPFVSLLSSAHFFVAPPIYTLRFETLSMLPLSRTNAREYSLIGCSLSQSSIESCQSSMKCLSLDEV